MWHSMCSLTDTIHLTWDTDESIFWTLQFTHLKPIIPRRWVLQFPSVIFILAIITMYMFGKQAAISCFIQLNIIQKLNVIFIYLTIFFLTYFFCSLRGSEAIHCNTSYGTDSSGIYSMLYCLPHSTVVVDHSCFLYIFWFRLSKFRIFLLNFA